MGFLDTLMGDDAAAASIGAARKTRTQEKGSVNRYDREGDQYAQHMAQIGRGYGQYEDGGKAAFSQMLAGLGLGAPGSQQAFTDAYRNSPGYQAGLDTGLHGVNANSNVNGMLRSGANEKALYRFGSNYEDNRVGDYLTKLMGASQFGMQGQQAGDNYNAQGQAGLLSQRGNSFGGQMQSAKTMGLGQVAAAQAQQAGTTNLLNAWATATGAAAKMMMGGGKPA